MLARAGALPICLAFIFVCACAGRRVVDASDSGCAVVVTNSSSETIQVYWQAAGDTALRLLRSVRPLDRPATYGSPVVSAIPTRVKLPRGAGHAELYAGSTRLPLADNRNFPTASARDSSLRRVWFGTSCD